MSRNQKNTCLIQIYMYYISNGQCKSGLSIDLIQKIKKSAIRFLEILPKLKISDNTLQLTHHGDDQSEHILAWVRAVQLEILHEFDETFKLRVIELDFIERGSLAQAFYTDSNVEFVREDYRQAC